MSQIKSKIRIRLKAYDSRILDKAVLKIIEIVEKSGVKIIGPIPLPTERKLTSVLRSPHVHKTSFEQFEMRIHKRILDVIEPTSKTIDNLMSLDLPAGVDIEIKT